MAIPKNRTFITFNDEVLVVVNGEPQYIPIRTLYELFATQFKLKTDANAEGNYELREDGN